MEIARFAMGRTEVTVAEFRRFVEASNYVTEAERKVSSAGCHVWDQKAHSMVRIAGRSWRDPGFAQPTDTHPVVCISWTDAQAYVRWLATRTGQSYQLPSEAQWEYAARAGSDTIRPWGNDLHGGRACLHANVGDKASSVLSRFLVHDCYDSAVYTSAVGRYAASRFGLHDMIGNVWEWTQDCYDEEAYAFKAPNDGRAYEVAGCSKRVSRGGAWLNGPLSARAANRNGSELDFSGGNMGLRVARMLP